MGLRPVLLAVFVLALPACSPPVTELQAAEPVRPTTAKPSEFRERVVPFVSKFCLSCHSDKKKAGGLTLEKYVDEVSALKDRKLWKAVLDNVHSREMPPEDAKAKPTPAEREAVEKVITEQLTQVDCGVARNPGQPTLRRLNRVEYTNTIRDLVGVTFNPTEDFPSDDVGYGFDNIGDVLSMPPILLEKYLRAAERILDEAVVSRGDAKPSKQTYRAQGLQATFRGARDPASAPIRIHLTQAASAFTNFEPPQEGDYHVSVDAFSENTTDEPVKMAFQIDKKDFKTVEVKGGNQKKPEHFEFKAKMAEGRHNVAVAFANALPANAKGDQKRSLSIVRMDIEGPFNPVPRPPTEAQKRLMIAKPKGKADEEDAARTIVKAFADRAYRRPVTPAEVDRLLKLYHSAKGDGEPFDRAVALSLRAVLVSPNFLFRVEKNPVVVDGSKKAVHPIGEYELATRLSYFLWSSTPDSTLMELAGKGELRKPGVLEAQVARMLKDPKASALTDNFAAQWLQLRTLDSHVPDRKTFRECTPIIKDLMVRETKETFNYVVREDRSILEFLDSNYTFLNETLARYYDIPNVSGNAFRKVTFGADKPNPRGGLLTQGSIMTLTSNPTRTSPVKRGKWILETILGTPPPPPPPDVPDLEAGAADSAASLRQRMEKHRENAVCASCHSKMDPLGFGLENFNAVGILRKNDGAFKIDSTGTLPNGEKFDGPAQLRKTLMGKADLFRRNLADKMVTYAVGRGTEYYDQCALDDIARTTAAGKDRFSALVTAIAKSDPFQKRRGNEE